MARTCTICTNPQRAEIDAALSTDQEKRQGLSGQSKKIPLDGRVGRRIAS